MGQSTHHLRPLVTELQDQRTEWNRPNDAMGQNFQRIYVADDLKVDRQESPDQIRGEAGEHTVSGVLFLLRQKIYDRSLSAVGLSVRAWSCGR